MKVGHVYILNTNPQKQVLGDSFVALLFSARRYEQKCISFLYNIHRQ